jgi:hypothetical protein
MILIGTRGFINPDVFNAAFSCSRVMGKASKTIYLSNSGVSDEEDVRKWYDEAYETEIIVTVKYLERFNLNIIKYLRDLVYYNPYDYDILLKTLYQGDCVIMDSDKKLLREIPKYVEVDTGSLTFNQTKVLPYIQKSFTLYAGGNSQLNGRFEFETLHKLIL